MGILIRASVLEKNVFNYLNQLRESGITNMYGATPYIVNMFGLSKSDARTYLKVWMDNFNEEGDYETVVHNYLSEDYRGSDVVVVD